MQYMITAVGTPNTATRMANGQHLLPLKSQPLLLPHHRGSPHNRESLRRPFGLRSRPCLSPIGELVESSFFFDLPLDISLLQPPLQDDLGPRLNWPRVDDAWH